MVSGLILAEMKGMGLHIDPAAQCSLEKTSWFGNLWLLRQRA